MKIKAKEKYKFTIKTKITPEIYRNFAAFDTFMLRKRWIIPAFGTAVFAALAGIFYMNQMILLSVAACIFVVAIPAIFYNTFQNIMRRHTRNAPRGAVIDDYLVSLTDEGFEVYSEEETAECTWADMKAAYRLSNCIALYIARDKSFLISQFNEPRYEEIWAFICDHSGNKAKDRQSSVS